MRKPSLQNPFGVFSWLESLLRIELTFNRTPWVKKKSKNLWLLLLLVAFLGPWGVLYASWLTSLILAGVYYSANTFLHWPKFVKVVFWWGLPAFTAFGIIFVQKLNEAAAANHASSDTDDFNPEANVLDAESAGGHTSHSVTQSGEEDFPASEPSESKTINGRTYVKIDGNWFEK